MKYQTRKPRAALVNDQDEESGFVVRPDTITIEPEGGTEERYTGLLDRHGYEIWTTPNKIGFIK